MRFSTRGCQLGRTTVFLALGLCLAGGVGRGAEQGWFPFNPSPLPDRFSTPIDLRDLNERVAGEHGWIQARDGHFVRTGDGETVRFWGVNGPPNELSDPAALRTVARMLARYGVNLVRSHGAVFNKAGDPDPARVAHLQAVVEAMKQEGIYTHLSIYFPLWMEPGAETPWLQGYDGHHHPFAALMFQPAFQEKYRRWWESVLTSPGPSGRRLVDEPAVFGVEVQNEDSFFFWTFSEQNIPGPQLELLESRFGEWLARRHGSVEAALKRWGGQPLKRDNPAAGRAAFRPLWNLAHERTARDQETAEFLFELQSRFYTETVAFLRKLGFRGLITASNWTTADNRILGPLEKLSYTAGDFMDRHGYFDCAAKGEAAEWSIRPGQTYADRSALRFDAPVPGAPRVFNHPVMDPKYGRMPSMISETTWNRPNRHRAEAPLFYACYGALQDSDAIVHFALDGGRWSVKPNYFMQPWTLMSPSQVGQFPAAARVFRQGLVRTGEVLADITLSRADLLALRGTPLPQDAAFDELRLKDVPADAARWRPGQAIDPLIHFAGRTRVSFGDGKSDAQVRPLTGLVDREKHRVTSSTGDLVLEYDRGLLEIRAPMAQGAGGALGAVKSVDLPDIRIETGMELAQIVVVAMDNRPLAESRRMLVQIMTEEQPTGWATEPADAGRRRIVRIGQDPWQVRQVQGRVQFKRGDAAGLRILALDAAGQPRGNGSMGGTIELEPETLYYLVSAPRSNSR